MLWFLFSFLLFARVSSASFGLDGNIEQLFENGLPEKCSKVYKSLSPLLKVKMIDASSKFITSGLLEGNIIDLGDFDECLSISDDKNEIYGKYCLTTVDINTFLSNYSPSKSSVMSLLLNQTENKIARLTTSKDYGNQIKALVKAYTSLAKFGICIPDKCKIENLGILKVDEAKCATKFSNDDLDIFAFVVLVILYFFALIAVVSTFYDMIIENLSMKPKHQILIAFSLYTNGKKLLSTTSTSGQLTCLNGIKVFSMMWVVLGHSYLIMLMMPLDNILYINNWIDNPLNMLVLSATVSVDTFFTIGGLLTVYVFMNSPPVKTKEGLKAVPLLYLHRYLRLTPAFGMMILIYASGLVKYVGSGPKWYSLDTTIEDCRQNWWLALLYVQNYLDYSKMCVTQSWYLSADFQLFIITPFLLIPLRKWAKYVIPVLCGIACIGMVIPFFIGYTNKWSGIGLGSISSAFADNYYFVTHTRFSPYFIGMVAGYYIYEAKRKSEPLKLNMGSILLLWTVTIVGFLGCVFDGFELLKNGDNAWIDGFYMGFNRSAWSVCIALLVFLCSTGYGGPIQKFLALPLFKVMSKLTYSMYLIHLIVIMCVNNSTRTKLHFSNMSILTYFFAHFSITLFISIFYCLIFESPMITIVRILFPNPKQKGSKELPK